MKKVICAGMTILVIAALLAAAITVGHIKSLQPFLLIIGCVGMAGAFLALWFELFEGINQLIYPKSKRRRRK